MYITDTGNGRIRRVSPDGVISTFAGRGLLSPSNARGSEGDGGLAIEAYFVQPTGIAVDRAGYLYVAETYWSRIRRVRPDGIIETIAGTDRGAGFTGDGGRAVTAQLAGPAGLAVDNSGNLLIADRGNGRIRKVNRDGIISTVAGGGSSSQVNRGDGGPATAANLEGLQAVSVDPEGNIYIAELFHVRMVDKNGIIKTIAGSGNSTATRDDGDAKKASILPVGICVDERQNVVISDRTRIRQISPQGIISTLAGDATTSGFYGDGGPASLALLGNPSSPLSGVLCAESGRIFFSDNNRVRLISASPSPASVPLGYMAQFADGDGWRTSLMIVNVSDREGIYELVFHSSDGNVTGPPLNPESGSLTGLIRPKGTVFVRTAGLPDQGVRQGWVSLRGSLGLSAQGVFARQIAENGEAEALSTFSLPLSGFVLPFVSNGDAVTGLAIANVTSRVIQIDFISRDEQGEITGRSRGELGPSMHVAFTLGSDQAPQGLAREGRGSLEVRSVGRDSALVGLGLRFNRFGNFSTISVTPLQ